MIGLDTNVLARFLTQDDARQSARATRLIEKAIHAGDALFINQVVLCELAWVLARAYDFGKSELIAVFEKILLARQFEIEDKASIWAAFAEFKASKADFADCLIGIKNLKAGCAATYTFDQAAAASGGYAPVPQS